MTGLIAIAVRLLEPRTILDVLGLASIPAELHGWARAIVWSLQHIALWVPIFLGLAIIVYANWNFIEEQIRSRSFRIAAIATLLVITFGASTFMADDPDIVNGAHTILASSASPKVGSASDDESGSAGISIEEGARNSLICGNIVMGFDKGISDHGMGTRTQQNTFSKNAMTPDQIRAAEKSSQKCP